MKITVRNLSYSVNIACLVLSLSIIGCDDGGGVGSVGGSALRFGVNNSWESEDGSSYFMGEGIQSEIDTNRDSVTGQDGSDVVFRAINQADRPFTAVVDFRDKSIIFTFADGEVRTGSILCDVEPTVEQDIFERCLEASMFVEGATSNPYTIFN